MAFILSLAFLIDPVAKTDELRPRGLRRAMGVQPLERELVNPDEGISPS
jgi:hypothetical protein